MSNFPTSVRSLVPVALLAAVLASGACGTVCSADWPQWRGPRHDGTSDETGLPIVWAENAGVEWKCKLPEWGNSTPVIHGDAIFLTSHEDDRRLLLLKIDRTAGRIVWTRQVGTGTAERAGEHNKPSEHRGRQKIHDTQNLASPSAVTDGRVVIAHFGNGDLAAYDFDGTRLWHRNLQEDYGQYSIWWGHANSPVLWGDLVISVCMQDSVSDLRSEPSPSYVVAHDKETGEVKWFTPRPTDAPAEYCDSYTTPLFWQNGDRTEMVVMGGQILDAYDPLSGERLWYLPGLVSNRVITGPVAAHGMIYATRGKSGPLAAVKPGGDGERTRDDIVWRYDEGTPDSPTPVVSHDLLLFVTNNGVAKCLDAHTGRLQWKERLKGSYRASPLTAERRIYFLNTKGRTTVVSASRRFDRLTENQLDDETFASPVASDGKLFIRGRKSLYCLSK